MRLWHKQRHIVERCCEQMRFLGPNHILIKHLRPALRAIAPRDAGGRLARRRIADPCHRCPRHPKKRRDRSRGCSPTAFAMTMPRPDRIGISFPRNRTARTPTCSRHGCIPIKTSCMPHRLKVRCAHCREERPHARHSGSGPVPNRSTRQPSL